MKVPVSPVLRRPSVGYSGATIATVLDLPEPRLVQSGRNALALALRDIGCSQDDELLLPAYHCPAMLAPAAAIGMLTRHYRLTPDLSPDLQDIEDRLNRRTRAVLAVHYFGRPQNLAGLRELCDRTGVALIEDSAHAFYRPFGPFPTAMAGDYCIGSLAKFFPLFDGGSLSGKRPLKFLPTLRSAGLLAELKAGLDIVERSAEWSSGQVLRLGPALLRRLRAMRSTNGPHGAKEGGIVSVVDGGTGMDARMADLKMTLASTVVLRSMNFDWAAKRRQAIYRVFLESISANEAGRALYGDAGAHWVPYVFPLLMRNPKDTFSRLRAAGIPTYRWELSDDSSCDVTRMYRLGLVHLPCHQGLTDAQVEWLASTISAVLRQSTATRESA